MLWTSEEITDTHRTLLAHPMTRVINCTVRWQKKARQAVILEQLEGTPPIITVIFCKRGFFQTRDSGWAEQLYGSRCSGAALIRAELTPSPGGAGGCCWAWQEAFLCCAQMWCHTMWWDILTEVLRCSVNLTPLKMSAKDKNPLGLELYQGFGS